MKAQTKVNGGRNDWLWLKGTKAIGDWKRKGEEISGWM